MDPRFPPTGSSSRAPFAPFARFLEVPSSVSATPSLRVYKLEQVPLWRDICMEDSPRFDLRRFRYIEDRYGYQQADEQWQAWKRHNPCSLALSSAWVSDLQFLRHPAEEMYLRR